MPLDVLLKKEWISLPESKTLHKNKIRSMMKLEKNAVKLDIFKILFDSIIVPIENKVTNFDKLRLHTSINMGTGTGTTYYSHLHAGPDLGMMLWIDWYGRKA